MTETSHDGWFVTFEGPDGCGKTTQIKMLAEHLKLVDFGFELLYSREELIKDELGPPQTDDPDHVQQIQMVLRVHEPGFTDIGEQIREVLHSHQNTEMHSRTEVLLYMASRAQIVHEVIRPHLARGGIVLSDRYADSSLAYQGYGHGLDLESVQQLVDFATGGLKPDITLFFDITPEEGIRRRKGVEEFNRLDAKALEYHHRVYKGYQELIAQEPDRWIVIDASKSIEEVHEDVVREVMTRLAMGRPT